MTVTYPPPIGQNNDAPTAVESRWCLNCEAERTVIDGEGECGHTIHTDLRDNHEWRLDTWVL